MFLRPPSQGRSRRPMSGSEASFNTGSTYGYESEHLEDAVVMKRRHLQRGLNVESDDEDER